MIGDRRASAAGARAEADLHEYCTTAADYLHSLRPILRKLKMETEMPDELIIRGLPRSLARDGWWLASETGHSSDQAPPSTPSPGTLTGGRHFRGFVGLIFLVLLGDRLFWAHKPGLSLAIFAWCIFGAAILSRPSRRGIRMPVGVLLLATLPVVEHVQLLSLSFLATGLVSAVALLRIPPKIEPGEIRPWLASAVIRLIETLPTAGIADCVSGIRDLRLHLRSRGSSDRASVNVFVRNWAFPLGGMLVLSALLISANPVLEHMLLQVLEVDFDVFALARRLVFWVGMALLIWPFLSARTPDAPLDFAIPNRDRSRVLNAGSVLRALVLFNMLLALQSLLDISILFGGAALPEGMSHATYAHRGAYPLLITALLAGGFALAARPFLKQRSVLKPLLLLWLAQNVLLTLSAAFRLNLYIEAFGLTYLRVHALIWMGLVAVGLALVVWQVLRDRPSSWLLLRVAGLGAGTLYVCAFVNFAALIATNTLARAADPEKVITLDWDYLCALGHTAAHAIVDGVARHQIAPPSGRYRACVHPDPTHPNWREWDFRTARVNGYLATTSHAKGAGR